MVPQQFIIPVCNRYAVGMEKFMPVTGGIYDCYTGSVDYATLATMEAQDRVTVAAAPMRKPRNRAERRRLTSLGRL